MLDFRSDVRLAYTITGAGETLEDWLMMRTVCNG